jgi:hypothetical protein
VVLAYGGIRWAVGRKERLRIDWHFFFLGAGFLLLEVQNISKLALLFGTTWTVNTIVITAVLVMGLLSNWFVIKVRVGSLVPYYIALYATLLFNFFLPLEVFSGMSAVVKGLLAGTIMALPMFFAGIIFSRSFEGAADRAGVFASNLFGAMIGGVLECLAFVLGIKALLLLTLGLYLLSMVVRWRRRSGPAGPRQVLQKE